MKLSSRYFGFPAKTIMPVLSEAPLRPARRGTAAWLGKWWPLLASALLTGCGDSDRSTPAGPQSDVNVAMSVTAVSSPSVRWLLPAGVELGCDVTLQAEASGTGTGTWLDAAIEFYDLRDTTRSLGAVAIAASELRTAWRQDTISAGKVVSSTWRVTGATAFGVVFQMRYQTGGTMRTSSASLHCAPPTPTAATAPSITTLSASPSSGAIVPLTPINVSFTANTPAGALFSYLRATGACTEGWGWAESFESSLSHSVPLTLGWPCKLGVPIGVEVVTYDAVGNYDTKRIATSVTLVDDQRPTVRTIFTARQGLDYIVSPYGVHLAGDTLLAEMIATDNYRIRTLHFEIYPFGVSDTLILRDSVVAGPGDVVASSASHRFPVRFRPEWEGDKLQFRFYARDVQGLLSNAYTTDPGCVRIVLSRVNAPSVPSTCAYDMGDPAFAKMPLTTRAPTSAAPAIERPASSAFSARRLYEARSIP